MTKPIHIIGAGMAGSEAAWQAVNLGVPVILHEMRPKVGTDAHRTGGFAELVGARRQHPAQPAGDPLPRNGQPIWIAVVFLKPCFAHDRPGSVHRSDNDYV